jgi:hypothetical protein
VLSNARSRVGSCVASVSHSRWLESSAARVLACYQRCSCCNCCAAGPNHQPPLASSLTARQQHAHSLPSLLDTYVTRQQCKAWLEVRARVVRVALHVRVTRPSSPTLCGSTRETPIELLALSTRLRRPCCVCRPHYPASTLPLPIMSIVASSRSCFALQGRDTRDVCSASVAPPTTHFHTMIRMTHAPLICPLFHIVCFRPTDTLVSLPRCTVSSQPFSHTRHHCVFSSQKGGTTSRR